SFDDHHGNRVWLPIATNGVRWLDVQRDRRGEAIACTHELSGCGIEPQRSDGEIRLRGARTHVKLAHHELLPTGKSNARRRTRLVGVVRLGAGRERMHEIAIVDFGARGSADGPQCFLTRRIWN